MRSTLGPSEQTCDSNASLEPFMYYKSDFEQKTPELTCELA